MDFTKIECISEKCKGKHIIMDGSGASFGGRVEYSNVECPECGLKLMIMPLSNKYEYTVSATTHEERVERRIQKAKDESALKLAETINRIKEKGY